MYSCPNVEDLSESLIRVTDPMAALSCAVREAGIPPAVRARFLTVL